MASKIEYSTQGGMERLRLELEETEHRLDEVRASKAYAAEVGGNVWHDNFAFEQCERDERQLMAARSRLIDRLARVRLIDAPDDVSTVQRGCAVNVRNEGEAVTRRYTILGPADSDPDAGLISDESPLGSCLLGARRGDIRSFVVNDRKRSVEIIDISVGGSPSDD